MTVGRTFRILTVPLTAILCVALVGIATPAVAADWFGSVHLSAQETIVDPADPAARLTATPTPFVQVPYFLSIYDTEGHQVRTCNRFQCTSLTGTTGVGNLTSRSFIAYVAQDAPIDHFPTVGVRAVSNTVTVQNIGFHGGLALTRLSRSESQVLIAAQPEQIVQGPQILSIYNDQGMRMRYCSTCVSTGLTTSVTSPYSFIAFVALEAPIDHFPTNGVVATSGYISPSGNGPMTSGETVGGYNPSEACSQSCEGDPVNTASGEFFLGGADLSVPSSGPQVGVLRNFATPRRNTDGMFGYGWSSSLDMTLIPTAGSTTLATATEITLRQENGSTAVFTRTTEDAFTAEARVLASLTQNTDGTFAVVRKATDTFRFSGTGQLLRVEDRNAQGVDLNYDAAGKLARISDDRGRFIDLTWSGPHVVSAVDHMGRAVGYEYTASGELKRVTLPDGTTEAYTYDHDRRMVAISHADGGVTENSYDMANRVIQQVDPLGRATTFEYGLGQTTVTDPTGAVTVDHYLDGQLTSVTRGVGTPLEAMTSYAYGTTNQVTSVTDPLGRTSRFSYDGYGNRTSATDPLGRMSTVTYDDWGNPTSITNAAGETTTFTYDTSGNLLTSTDPTGATTTITVNPDGTVASSTDPLGRTTTYTYDQHGYVATVTAPDGAIATAAFDSLGRMTATTDPRGMEPGAHPVDYTTSLAYDPAGRLLSTTDPLGAVVAFAYDQAGRPTETTNALGATTTNEYDLAGQVVAVTDALENRTEMVYDDAGRVTTITDALGAITSYEYDVLGRLIAVTDPLGRTSHAEYDAGDRVTATVSPSGSRTSYTYDAADQLLNVTDPLGGQMVATYDVAGRPLTVTDADGRAVAATYDDAGRPVSIERADGSVLSWSYNAAGQVTAHTDAASSTTSYTYDDAGRLATATDTAGRTTSYAYGPSGLLDTVTRPGGGQISYTYDRVGRRTGIDYSDATPDVSYEYDAAGRVTAMTDGTGTTTYDYDAADRPVEVSGPDATVGYAWDSVGRLTALTYPTGDVVHRTYDAAGQLSSVTDWADREYAFDWTVDGQLAELSYPNEVQSSYDYDAAGQVLGITTDGVSGLELLEFSYGYSAAGLLVDQGVVRSGEARAPPAVPSSSASTYQWDLLGRIAEVTGDGAGLFDFDAAGSVMGLADGRALTYDTARQVTSMTIPASAGEPATTTSFSYDTRSNRISSTTDVGSAAGTVTHTFDLADRLTSVTGIDETVTHYAYDGAGLRVSATTGGGPGAVTEDYVWDRLAAVPLLLTDAEYAYIYGVGTTPLAQVDLGDGTVDYLHADLVGSVRSTTDGSGLVTSESDYDVYGLPVVVSGAVATADVTRFGYAGEYTDPTGYIYLRARYYDPATAQFLSRDPLVDRTGDPYGYTGGNPLQFTDPLGLDWLDDMGTWFAGFGDTITFGGTREIRRLINDLVWGETDDMVDHCSVFYTWGSIGGAIASTVPLTGGLAWVARAATARFPTAAASVARAATAARSAVSSAAARIGARARTLVGRGVPVVGRGAANTARALPPELAVGRNAQSGVHVYQGVDAGKPVYAGITDDIARRQLQHGDRFVLDQLTPAAGVTRGQARAIEEALIVRNPGFQNARHEISPRHSWYQDALDWGNDWLMGQGL